MNSSVVGVVVLCGLWASACSPVLDNKAVTAEREKPVRRYDNFLATVGDGGQLVSAGGNGVMVTSTDAGKTWTRVELASPSAVVAMTRCPDHTLVALDFYHKVWVGDGRGAGWQARKVEGNFNPLAITCDPRNRLWVVGSFSTILSSSDQGKSWQAQPPGQDAILTAVQWMDADHGLVAGEFGTLLVTSDGGATWSKQAGLPAEFYPYSMMFSDTQNGWMSSQAGTIIHTMDGGKTWAAQVNPSAAPIYSFVRMGGRLIGVGGGGQILKLEGNEWHAVPNLPQFPAYLAGATPLAPSSLLVAGAAGALNVVDMTSEVSR